MLRIGVDIGGTFTDFCGWREGTHDIVSLKVPSTPASFEEGFRNGFELLLERMDAKPDENALVMHGTTVSTNAVIERKGPKIAFLVTKGYRDLLALQRMGVKEPLNVFDNRPLPLIDRSMVFEVDERLLRGGTVRTHLDRNQVEAIVNEALDAGAEGFAVALLHSYANPQHESEVANAIKSVAGDSVEISLSSEIWPRIGEYERAIVSVLNAFVRKRMDEYIGAVESYLSERLPGSQLFVTRSNGGAMSAKEARRFPVHTLLSGPASGVSAVQYLGNTVGERNILTLDMGGTSTDISIVREGEALTSSSAEVGEFPVVMPVTGIEAVGAGGGSIVDMDNGIVRVGPESAGSFPGPACFGRGGDKPTLTDAFLLAGYLPPTLAGVGMDLDRDASIKAFRPISDALKMDPLDAAEMCISVASSNMIAGVMPFLAKYGLDPEDLTLCVYGGAGAIHGPLLAAEIGVERILVPTTPSVFCALGGLVSDLTNDLTESVHGLEVNTGLVTETFERLRVRAETWLSSQINGEQLIRSTYEYWAEMRYAGQSFQVDVRLPESAVKEQNLSVMLNAFHDEHERIYSHSSRDSEVEFVDLRMRVRGTTTQPSPASSDADPAQKALKSKRTMHFQGKVYSGAPVYERDGLELGQAVVGPAVIEQPDATIVVPIDFVARVSAHGTILMTRS